jgi:hypothetical protein
MEIKMLDIFITVVMFVIGWMIGTIIFIIIRSQFIGRKIIEDDPNDAAEAIANLPRLKLEEVDYKDQKVYLVSQLPGKFLGQGMSIDEVRDVINKRFAGQQVIIVSQDETEGTIVTVPNA